jgi:hypothetical protein
LYLDACNFWSLCKKHLNVFKGGDGAVSRVLYVGPTIGFLLFIIFLQDIAEFSAKMVLYTLYLEYIRGKLVIVVTCSVFKVSQGLSTFNLGM